MRAVEHHLALLEPRLLDEPEIDLLAGQADDAAELIFVIFAPIAGAQIADGEEREIVVVGDVVEERRIAARLEHAVALRRPEIGADEIFLRGAVEHDHLARIAILEALAGAAVLQLGERDVGEEGAVEREPAEQRPGGGEAVLVGGIEGLVVQRLDELAELDRRGLRVQGMMRGMVRRPCWRSARVEPVEHGAGGCGAARDGDRARPCACRCGSAASASMPSSSFITCQRTKKSGWSRNAATGSNALVAAELAKQRGDHLDPRGAVVGGAAADIAEARRIIFDAERRLVERDLGLEDEEVGARLLDHIALAAAVDDEDVAVGELALAGAPAAPGARRR